MFKNIAIMGVYPPALLFEAKEFTLTEDSHLQKNDRSQWKSAFVLFTQ